MTLDTILKILGTIGSPVVMLVACLVVLKERARRSQEDLLEMRKEMAEFSKEFRTYLVALSVTTEKHTVIQKVLSDTLDSILTKVEKQDARINENTTAIAVLNLKKVK
jgi:hypothetical protein